MNLLFKHCRLLVVTLSVSFLLMACDQKQQPPGLVYCSEGNPESFNPQLVTSGTTIDATANQIYNQLLSYDNATGAYSPELATAWTISDDGLNYTLTLRHNVQFQHNAIFSPTRPFNADDVIFSFERIINPNHPYHAIAKQGYPFFQSVGFDKQIKSIRKLADDKVVFTLYQPNSTFLANLATDFAVILSAQYGQQLQQLQLPELLDNQPIGTGPFVLHKYVKNGYIRYYRNDEYWGDKAKIPQLVFDITTKSTMRLAKVITGSCSISALPKPGELSVINDNPNLKIERKVGMNVAFWAFNTEKPPFNNIEVRRALAMAVNKQKILDAVYQDTAAMANTMLPPSSWGYSEIAQDDSYDPVAAKALLDSTGYKNITIDIWAMPVSRVYNPNSLKTAELIQEDLANIGVRANIISYDWSVFNQKLHAASYDSVLLGWYADNADPDNFFSPLLSCNALASNSNEARWCNLQFDRLIQRAKQTTDQQQRKRLYHQVEELLQSKMPIVPLAHAQQLLLTQTDIEGVKLSTFGSISFNHAEKVSPQEQE